MEMLFVFLIFCELHETIESCNHCCDDGCHAAELFEYEVHCVAFA